MKELFGFYLTGVGMIFFISWIFGDDIKEKMAFGVSTLIFFTFVVVGAYLLVGDGILERS